MNDGRRRSPSLPADLAFVLGLVGLTALSMATPVVRETPLRVAFGLAFGLFAPGYAFVAAMYPDGDGRSTGAVHRNSEERRSTGRGIDGLTRLVLSVGSSVVVVPVLGIALTFTPWGIRPWPVFAVVGAFTVVCTAVAVRRRRALPAGERFVVPYREWLAAGRRGLSGDAGADGLLNVLIVASVLVALASVGYAATVPQEGDQFTEFYLLTQNESGDLVAEGYPSTLTVEEPEPLHVGVENREHETIEYTVVVQLQRVAVEDDAETVTERDELDRFTLTLDHGETSVEEHDVTASDRMAGEDRRLTFLLYAGDVPETPTRENAYRSTHIWVDVEEP